LFAEIYEIQLLISDFLEDFPAEGQKLTQGKFFLSEKQEINISATGRIIRPRSEQIGYGVWNGLLDCLLNGSELTFRESHIGMLLR
jgi:hypothetical protein